MVHRSVDLVNTQISRLFRSHPDLLSEFALFLPERRPKSDSAGGGYPSSSRLHNNRNKGAPGSKDAKALDPSGSPSYVHEDKGRRDLQLFERIKKRLSQANPTQYNDFLKCVHLFTQDVLSRDDLVEVLQDLLGTGTPTPSITTRFWFVNPKPVVLAQAHTGSCLPTSSCSSACATTTPKGRCPCA